MSQALSFAWMVGTRFAEGRIDGALFESEEKAKYFQECLAKSLPGKRVGLQRLELNAKQFLEIVWMVSPDGLSVHLD